MINDKVFLVLWFWYFALTVFGTMRFIYRIAQLSSKNCRYYVMKMRIYR